LGDTQQHTALLLQASVVVSTEYGTFCGKREVDLKFSLPFVNGKRGSGGRCRRV